MKEEELYTIAEIAMATGKKRDTLNSRRRRLNIPPNHSGYTLQEVKAMIKPAQIRRASKQKAAKLRAQLLNDGAI
jgi:hypothetical protein